MLVGTIANRDFGHCTFFTFVWFFNFLNIPNTDRFTDKARFSFILSLFPAEERKYLINILFRETFLVPGIGFPTILEHKFPFHFLYAWALDTFSYAKRGCDALRYYPTNLTNLTSFVARLLDADVLPEARTNLVALLIKIFTYANPIFRNNENFIRSDPIHIVSIVLNWLRPSWSRDYLRLLTTLITFIEGFDNYRDINLETNAPVYEIEQLLLDTTAADFSPPPTLDPSPDIT
jgi:hypothetical protein